MKQITLRDIPGDISKVIEKKAKKEHLSLNKAIISLLEKATGAASTKTSKKKLYHDLDHLAGAWSRKEADSFEKNLQGQRTIDKELWRKTG